MGYVYQHLSADDVTRVKAEAVRPPATTPRPDEMMLRRWEMELAAHEALRDSKSGEDRKPHEDAIAAIMKAMR